MEVGIPTAMKEGSFQGVAALLTPERDLVDVSQVILAIKGVSGKVDRLALICRVLKPN
jgi:hypothetical protein